jgi:hypothetical protein
MEICMTPHEREHKPQTTPHSKPNPGASESEAVTWPHPPRPFFADREEDSTARLEWLDDLMFAAIDGDPAALDCAADAWKRTREELGDSALEESRVQYLRHAQTVWHSLRGQSNHAPHKVFAAIEIISLLASKPR